MAPFRQQVEMLRDLPLPALQRVEYFIRGMFQHLRENRDMPRFMVQEIVLGDHPAAQILESIKVVAPILVEIIQEGQSAGTIREGDPVLMALSTLSQPIYLSIMPLVLANRELREAGVPQPRVSPEDHAVEFVLRSLRGTKGGTRMIRRRCMSSIGGAGMRLRPGFRLGTCGLLMALIIGNLPTSASWAGCIGRFRAGY